MKMVKVKIIGHFELKLWTFFWGHTECEQPSLYDRLTRLASDYPRRSKQCTWKRNKIIFIIIKFNTYTYKVLSRVGGGKKGNLPSPSSLFPQYISVNFRFQHDINSV